MNIKSKYHDQFYNLILKGRSTGDDSLDKALLIVNDISDRRGLKHEFSSIDGDIQDEIVETWKSIIEKK